MVQEIHAAVKGRVRYRVGRLCRSEDLKKRLVSNLSGMAGISQVSANSLTGTVLVIFNSDNTSSKIASLIREIVSHHDKDPRSSITSFSPDFPFSQKKINRQTAQAEGPKGESWYLIEATSVVASFNTSKTRGLSSESAREQLKRHGPNLLPESVPRSGISMFVDQFKSLPVVLLGVAAGLSLLTAGMADAVVILGVVVINAAIGYVTESQAERTIQSLKSLVRPSAVVVRDGRLTTVKAEEVVLGDILVLKPGTYIAADGRLIDETHLHLDESALTGESMPVLKTSRPLAAEDLPLADRVNMVYMGTLVTGGSGFAVVVATGRFTEMGRIQTMVGEAEPPETPMERQLHRLGTELVIISGAVCGLVFFIGLLRGYGFLEMLKISVSLAVAAVPEGLPTVATTTLALGIRNMKKHHVMIRHLEAVETLGSVQTICLDKTGTITMNRMSVSSIYSGMRSMTVSDGKFISGDELVNPFAFEELLRLIHVVVLCSETEVSMQEGEYILKGSPTENALIHIAISSGVDILQLRERHPLIKMAHRSESRNFMSTLHLSDPAGTGGQPPLLLALKGSPAEVLAMCDWHIEQGKKILLTGEDRLRIEIENERMSGNALRVLGAACAYVDSERVDDPPREGLIWLGLIGMSDPIRKGVKELIGAFHLAGIDTVMITGDQGPTAYAIGKELNLAGNGQMEILDSTHLTKIQPDVMTALSSRVHVFSRVSPAHKLRIVQALQKGGKVVAMTGDGINDGPALKAADIGIAMGHTGTDVAREVADVVLENDNLETMIIAISHGRTIYNNIRKSVHFLLSTNLSEIMVTFTAISVGLGQPLNTMQLLWINLISDIFPGLALAMEPPEPDILSQLPRNPMEPIIKKTDFKRIGFEAATLSAGALGAYGYGIMRYGPGPRAGTMAFMSLTMGQLLHAVSCRSEKHSPFLPPNRSLQIALGGSFALQALALTVPGLRNLLGITRITLLDGAVIGGSALLPLLVNEATKEEMVHDRPSSVDLEKRDRAFLQPCEAL
ncbi:MAG: cation-translocating P-type ATPase [Nitrospiria bacterium]